MPTYIFESRALKLRSGPIAGVDEAGRGPLAGPVVAAAVILDRKRIPKGLNDSKQMTAEAREIAFTQIMECAIAVGVGEASVDEIDLVNIRQATHLAMARAVRAMAVAPLFALVAASATIAAWLLVPRMGLEGGALALGIASFVQAAGALLILRGAWRKRPARARTGGFGEGLLAHAAPTK